MRIIHTRIKQIVNTIKLVFDSGLEPVVYLNGELYPIAALLISDETEDTVDSGTPIIFLDKHEVETYLTNE